METRPHPFATFAPEEAEQPVGARVDAQARRHPGSVAVKSGDVALTYAELVAAANRVARATLAEGAGAAPVALLLPHDTTAVSAFLGVLKAGAIATPLLEDAPDAFLAAILDETGAALLITAEAARGRAEGLARGRCRVLTVEEIARGTASDEPGVAVRPDAVACLQYTSGSTGRPKGVPQLHRNLVHLGLRLGRALGVSPADRLTLLASMATGQGVTNFSLALVNGAGLYVWDVRSEGLATLASWLEREALTVYRSSASVFRHFTDALSGRPALPHLRVVGLSSEPVHAGDVERHRRHFDERCRMAIVLSSTETGSVFANFIDRATPADGPTPIGYPLQDMDVLIVDESGAEVAPGEPGEILVRSRYLFPGYWRRPELTTRVLGPDPSGGEARVYRTGDLGRALGDGRFVHLGRRDLRVKIRGQRVETTAVELTLGLHPDLTAAAVAARPDRNGDLRLVAYVVPRHRPGPGAAELRRFLRERLPDSALPAAFVPMVSLPITESGKVDRRALPDPDATVLLLAHRAAPRTPVEELIAKIWGGVLGLDRVPIDVEFLEFGGNSLLAARIGARVLAELDVAIPLRSLMEAATVERMALTVTEHLVRALPPEALADLAEELEPRPGGARPE